ncbi:hypothetical protein IVB45_32055 [Bradyrhizobium sp. 4]|uniref:hypothetical protein n=2 Tax=Bradyrhizobium TaxID=374 RepID=UPI001FF98F61|nr:MULTISPECIES: hypothetical protein [unclassified Bradyrhizobium]MCK1398713.1 hypothetical protein [Bradyrhizobium sp. 39]MCK1751957.1 hypothetical protein [Bradyrhizobium sp. 135]UPJ34503.1 hypothetical protein IVB45_32055 [Bradyrhizobium sp. 4]
MMELYIRRINLELMDRTFVPMAHNTSPSRRSFINEIAFQMFCRSLPGQQLEQVEAHSIADARRLILGLENADVVIDPKEDEMDDAREQARRLDFYFLQIVAPGRKLEVKPRFAGCGIIDSCEGDVYCDGQLFEIKAGDRNVRSIDLRQLLVYAALNYSEGGRSIDSIGLFNPRIGTHFSSKLDEVCAEISGHPAAELLAEIVQVVSSGDISR